MKYLLALVFLLEIEQGISQTLNSIDSVSIYISKLNWESFAVGTTYMPQITLKDDAKKLLEISDRTKINKLLTSLSEENKTVVIHQILTRLLEPSKGSFGELYIYGEDSTIKSIVFSYNGLKWTRDSQMVNRISQKEIDRIERYWKKKCHL